MSANEIKYPRHSPHSKVERALRGIAKDGQPHRLLEMGQSTAEQTARSYNVEGASWELGYRLEAGSDGTPVSVLYARWIGDK